MGPGRMMYRACLKARLAALALWLKTGSQGGEMYGLGGGEGGVNAQQQQAGIARENVLFGISAA
jgi:hypothetical protein